MKRKTPWLCRRGHHAWTFVRLTHPRVVDIPGHTATLCTLVEECRRCYLRRTTAAAPIPRKVKIR